MDGDLITDLDSDDTIDFQFNNSDQNGSGLLADHFLGSTNFTGYAGQYRYFSSGGQTFIQVDTDGDAVADETLTIANGAFALGETFAGSNILHIIGSSGTSGADTLSGTLGDDFDLRPGRQRHHQRQPGHRLHQWRQWRRRPLVHEHRRRQPVHSGHRRADLYHRRELHHRQQRHAQHQLHRGRADCILDRRQWRFQRRHRRQRLRLRRVPPRSISGSATATILSLEAAATIASSPGFGSNVADGGAGYDFAPGQCRCEQRVTVTIQHQCRRDARLPTPTVRSNQLAGFEEAWSRGVGNGAVTLDASGYGATRGTDPGPRRSQRQRHR